MGLANVLDFLTSELARHGADIVSATDLSALTTVERHLDVLGLPDPDIARAVAWTASLTPDADREAFKTTFGEPASDLLSALMPTRQSPAGARIDRWITWAKATAQVDAQVRSVAVALLAGEANKVSGFDERRELGDYVGIAVRNATDEAVRTSLTAIHEGLASDGAVSAEAVPNPPARLISMSIDLVSSTDAKRRLRDLAADDARRDQLYREFYNGFLHEEDRFYADLFAPGIWGHGPPLDWRRLFVVKGIGDEIWLTYDASPPNGIDADTAVRQAAIRMISAALSLAGRTMTCGGTAEDLGPGFDREAEESQRYDRMDLPFKVSIDLVEDAMEISGQRLDFLAERVGTYLSPPSQDTGPSRPAPFGASHAEILRRLNAGHFELAGGHRVRQAYRTDFIGPHIDRFFRITKFALPGLVMVGDDLMRVLRFDVAERFDVSQGQPSPREDAERPRPEFDRIHLTFPCDLHDADSHVAFAEPLLRRRTELLPTDLKGIGAGYAVHHLIGIPSFRGTVNRAKRIPPLGETVAAYPEALRTLIAPKAGGDPTEGDDTAEDASE